MKKLLTLILFCSIGLAAYAQRSFYEGYDGPNGQTAADQAFERLLAKMFKKADEQTILSSLKVGKYVFTLENETDGEQYNHKVHQYVYRPQNGPATFREAVAFDTKTKEPQLISSMYAEHSLVGPIYWRYEDFTIDEITVSIYEGNVMYDMLEIWRANMGRSCVSLLVDMMGNRFIQALKTPRYGFIIEDNKTGKLRTVIIVANVPEDKLPYCRKCEHKAPGRLFNAFERMAERLKRKLA